MFWTIVLWILVPIILLSLLLWIFCWFKKIEKEKIKRKIGKKRKKNK